MRSEMPLCFGRRRECQRNFFAARRVGSHLPSLSFPALNQLRIIHNLDLSLVIREAHPAAKALLVKATQLQLIIVMVRRAKKCPTQSASRDICEISLDRFGFGNVDSIEMGLSQPERMLLEEFSIQRQGAIISKAIKRRFRFRREPHVVPFRLFKE